jgi:hypothetical protein
LKEFEIKLDLFKFGSVQFQFELRRPALCHLGPHVGAPSPPCLSLFISLTPRLLPLGPVSPRSCLSVTLASHQPRWPRPSSSPVHAATPPPMLDDRGPLPVALSCPPPRQAPALLLLPPPRGRTCRAPFPFFPFDPTPLSCFSKCRLPPCPRFAPFSSHPRPSHRSRAPPP